MNTKRKFILILAVFLVIVVVHNILPKNEAPTPTVETEDNSSELYGFWVALDSYIVISGKEMFLTEYIRNESQIDHGRFTLTSINENLFQAEFLESGKAFSLELTENGKKLTIANDKKTITYKYTEVTPDEYVSRYNQ
ncbi:hypothetical protein [Bacillus suaedae]|uniref:Uncharacterized protein n=1 Tax=Halalkalibacter suaedae TaxID=2822140 RepID=A0A940WYN1_9BACI|nr:hypothetical protein [Bacillus suaedae]MBP3950916.1 hypothetical protein [Bacillus suaedae]